MTEMEMNEDIRGAIQALVRDAYRVSADLGDRVDRVLKGGIENPLSKAEVIELLNKVVVVLRNGAASRGDHETVAAMDRGVSSLVERVVSTRERVKAMPVLPTRILPLVARNGIDPKPVFPRPVFHGM